jgi:hypothetical protein
MKFNWGSGIVLAFILFAAGTLVMVFISMNSKTELVTDHYYEKEQQYQKQIDILENTRTLEENISCALKNDTVFISFPVIASYGDYSGQITLFRPSRQEEDFSLPVILDSSYTIAVSMKHRNSGLWKIKIPWQVHSTQYYFESILTR